MHAIPKVLLDAAAVAAQIAALCLISAAAREAADLLPFRVPSSALGLGALFLMLVAGWIRVEWIGRGAALLARHLGLFLVPVGVGMMAYGALLRHSGPALVAVLVLTTLLGIGGTALLCAWASHLEKSIHASTGRISHE